MLNTQYPIVARHAQGGDDALPLQLIVSPAHGAEDPRTRIHLSITLRIQHAVQTAVVRVDSDILCMKVMYRNAQLSNRNRNINSLPPEMARIEIDTNRIASQVPQLQERLRVIDAEARMRLQRNLHTGRRCGLRDRFPVRYQQFGPLPLQHLRELRRPGSGDPVRRTVLT